MSDFKVGFSKVNMNPPLGIGIRGYYVPRFAKGFLDDLYVRMMAVSCGGKTVLMASVEVCAIETEISKRYSRAIAEKTGVTEENIFITATHTHTGPLIGPTDIFEANEEQSIKYGEFLKEKLCDAAVLAIADLKNAKMGYRVVSAPDNIAFIRRYKMKDGTTMTCPPYDKKNDILSPIGTLDQRVNVLRFDREDACSIVIVNYGIHADTVNGEMISPDFPGWMAKTIFDALGAECMFFPGAQGDVGSTNLYPVDGDMNDTQISFDNEMKSPGMARFVGRALAGAVLQVYDKVKYIDVDSIGVARKDVFVSANKADEKDLPLARKYKKLHDEGRDSEIPFTGMELTTVVAEAIRMCNMENAPDEFKLTLSGLRIGDVALVGIPGEPFTEIGVKIKQEEGWGLIMPCALTNGYEKYFPVKSAFDEGGYEARTSAYKGDVADKIILGSKQLLKDMRK